MKQFEITMRLIIKAEDIKAARGFSYEADRAILLNTALMDCLEDIFICDIEEIEEEDEE
jgi:hypothetical protein